MKCIANQQQTARNIEDAIRCHQAGDLQQAGILYRQILEKEPGHADALYLLGVIAHQRKQYDSAVELLIKAIENNPSIAVYHHSLGNVFKDLGKFDAAIECYEKALRLRPDYAEVYNNLGNILKDLDRLDEAVECYQKAIKLKPDCVETYNILGKVLKDQGKLSEAISCFKEALRLNPDDAELYYYNMGVTFQHKRELDEAIACYKAALKLKPDHVEAHNNLGNVFRDQGKLSQAVSCFKEALRLEPDCAEVYNNLGRAFSDMGRVSQTIECFQKALQLNPNSAVLHSNLLFSLHYHTPVDPAWLFSQHQQWDRQHASPFVAGIKQFTNTRTLNRRLRIGYVSPDFRVHSVGYFIEPILASHDPSAFEIFCYSNVSRPDSITNRLKGLVSHWQDIVGMSDKQAAGLIRNDKIDILVDLAGHTGMNRMLLFARKPAPIQVTYLGYPNTTGLATMDCRVTDSWADPPNQTEHLHTEELIRLKHGFLCYKPPEESPAVADLPARKLGRITFGSFNALQKINQDVVSVWSKILTSVANARLILKSKAFSDHSTQERLRSMFAKNGVSDKQVNFFGHTKSIAEHFEMYNSIDIGLDTFPYNGTTTTCEAMWMGVPVITLAGEAHVSRVGVSLLSNIGLAELIAESTEGYVKKAVQLANDPDRLQYLRSNLQPIIAQSSLLDARGFTRSLEKAYRKMWHRWCNQGQEKAVKNNGIPRYSDETSVMLKQPVAEQAISINQKGENLFNAGQQEKAAVAFKKALKIQPNYAVAHNNLGVLYWQAGKMNQAVECFKKALEIDPHDKTANLNMNEALQVLNQEDYANPIRFPQNRTGPDKTGKISGKAVKPTIRILHNMARTGGTVISKCLGCMQDVTMLSEIHPLGKQWINPLQQAHDWFNLLTDIDMQFLKDNGHISFEDTIFLIHQRCLEHDKTLLIRDWSHLDFTAIPFMAEPSYKLATYEGLSNKFEVIRTAIVRHPIDQWLSLSNLKIMQGKITLEEFLKGYLRFATYCREMHFTRYEDFCTSTEKEIKKLCERLSLNYDPKFTINWHRYDTITGDINSRGRYQGDIKPVPRRKMGDGTMEQFERNTDYLESIEILGYGHPLA